MAGPKRARNLWVWLLIASVLSAVYVAWGRVRVERSNTQVELVMDYDAAASLCRAADYPVDVFLRRAKLAGLTSVALNERTIGDLLHEAKLHAFSGKDILHYDRLAPVADPTLRQMIDEKRLLPGNSYLFPCDEPTYDELAGLLTVRLAGERISTFQSRRVGPFIESARGMRDLESVTIGLDPKEVREAGEAGLKVVARFKNYSGITPEKAAFFLDRLPEGEDAPELVIFEGMEVLGYPRYMREVASALRGRGLVFGRIEFAAQNGDRDFARLMGPEVVRVHSITEREMEKIPLDKAVERFARAARERNIRVMYIRPFPAAGGDAGAISRNLDYIEAIASRLSASGFPAGQASPFKPYAPSRYLLALVGAGILAGAFVLLDRVFFPPPVIELCVFGLGIVAYAALLSTGLATFARQIAALGASIVFPALAVSMIDVESVWHLRRGGSAGLLDVGLLWLKASGITLVGGLLVAGTLSSTGFMLNIDQFAGVKVAHILPLIIVAFLYYWAHFNTTREESGRGFMGEVYEFLGAPIRVWHVLVMGLVAAVGAVYILRTGNVYFGLPIPAFDEGMRKLLENVFVFRPRTKEFLIGHPALLLATAAMLAGNRGFALPFALAGCIGQISMVNTFSHIHTPLLGTVLRTLYGLTAGGIIGIILAATYLHFTLAGEGRLEGLGEEERFEE